MSFKSALYRRGLVRGVFLPHDVHAHAYRFGLLLSFSPSLLLSFSPSLLLSFSTDLTVERGEADRAGMTRAARCVVVDAQERRRGHGVTLQDDLLGGGRLELPGIYLRHRGNGQL